MSTQLLDHLQQRLRNWLLLNAGGASLPESRVKEWHLLRDSVASHRQSLDSLDHVPVQQRNLEHGSIELF